MTMKRGIGDMPRLNTHDDLRAAVVSHEANIQNLGNRIAGVEQTMHGLQTEVHSGFAKIGDKFGHMDNSFSRLENLITKNEASKGPGISEVMKIVLGGGALVGMSAAAITVLVTSFMAPELTNLKDSAAVLTEDLQARTNEARKELVDSRKAERDRMRADIDGIKEDLTTVKEKIGWIGRVEATQ